MKRGYTEAQQASYARRIEEDKAMARAFCDDIENRNRLMEDAQTLNLPWEKLSDERPIRQRT